MLISTANIKHGVNPMTQWKVRLDVKTAKSRSGIVGWQEIKSDRYKRAVREVYNADWDQCEMDTPIPISVRKANYEILKSGQRLTHRGKAGASPNRYITWAFVKAKDVPFKFVVMNTHYVSGAWNDKRKYAKLWRQQVWLEHWQVQRDLVRGFHNAGYSILGTGDFNRVEVRRFHEDQCWITKGGIDKLWWLAGANGPKFTEISPVFRTELYSDHDLKTARVRLH